MGGQSEHSRRQERPTRGQEHSRGKDDQRRIKREVKKSWVKLRESKLFLMGIEREWKELESLEVRWLEKEEKKI